MKILCVCCLWESFRDVIYNGKNEPDGMTASYRVLRELNERGHDIDYIFYSYFPEDKSKKMNINSDWIFETSINNIVFIRPAKGLKKLYTYALGAYKLYSAVSHAISNEKYDFVYGQGPTADVIANLMHRKKIPYATRRFGDQYYNMIKEKGFLYASLASPFEYLSFKVRKEFMLCTNDGSGLDKAFNIIWKNKKSPYEFYHVLNGVDKKIVSTDSIDIHTSPYLLYVARVTKWKRQDLAIDLVNKLKENGIHVNLYIAGHNDISSEYFEYLTELGDKYGISDQIKYLGVINKEKIYQLSYNAIACLSFYDICNLGNVFLEYMAAGGLVIARNDGSLNDLIINDVNGFLIDDIKDGVEIIKNLMNDTKKYNFIKSNAKKTSDEKVLNWDDRINFEIDLIIKTLK